MLYHSGLEKVSCRRCPLTCFIAFSPSLLYGAGRCHSPACSTQCGAREASQGDKTAACSPVQEWQVGIWTLTRVRTSTSPASLTGRSGCHSVVAKGEACWGVRRELHRCVTEMRHGVFYSIYAVGTANVRQHRKILPVVSRELNWAVM